MDHKKIKNEEIIERYILRKLPPDEEKLFEQHYFNCDLCFEAVKQAEKVIPVIKEAAERGVIEYPPEEVKKESIFDYLVDWFKSRTLSPIIVVTTAVLMLTMLYPAWRGIFFVSQLQQELNEIRKPQANIQSYYLEQKQIGMRAEERQIKISLDRPEKPFILNFNIFDRSIPDAKYKAEISDNIENVIWKDEDLKAIGEYEVFSIACPSSFFKNGIYTLKVCEINPKNEESVNEFLFTFEILRDVK